MQDSADASDALSALAPLFRVKPELQVLCRFGQSWESPHRPEPAGWAPFHMVTAGECILDMPGSGRVTLQAGDLALLPQGDAHVMRSAIASTHYAPIRTRDRAVIQVRTNGDEPDAELICGRLTFEQPHNAIARAALPPLIVLRMAEDRSVAKLHRLLMTIRDELEADEPGARAVCADLASALLVMALRTHFQRQSTQAGLLRLLTKRQTARAVTALLDDPARAWTLDEMAAVAQTSRATLVRDFRKLGQMAPLTFLAELRLGLGRQLLAETPRPLADIAFEVGYQSPTAFARAFHRHFGLAPSDVRQDRY